MTAEQLKALEEFKSEYKPKNLIYLFRDEIFELQNSGYSISQIMQYLNLTYQFKTSERSLSRILATKKTITVEEDIAREEPIIEDVAKSRAAAFFTNKTKEV